ncbi:hypothetical protein [Paraburkholderia strydomiana]|uniref:hypothetical protein n=1 Tax=Paraburkholderia strydomiana TaxID=1245417 RepID=UPI001BE4E2C1|nr:hypothetical protein [Paraburkholderia strydomiana]MBT2791944.1 hypothetical protein [Paraburkholderia strydomiana]
MKRFGPSLYFASDKVIFDSINQRAVNVDLVRELLEERGIFVSTKTSKEELAKYFSRLTADYFDHQSIASKLGRIAKKERFTAFDIDNEIERDQIVDAVKEMKKEADDRGEVLNFDTSNPDRIVIEIAYDHIDYTKTELRQVQPRDAIIEFIKDTSGKYSVRNTHNNYTDSVVEKICKFLGEASGETISKTTVNLQSHPEATKRTAFFEALIKGVDNHELVTVTEAFCYKPPKGKLQDDDDDDNDEKELEDSPLVERVGLRGRAVTKSLVIDGLYKSGYYIIKVIWQVKPKISLDSDIFELEAQFSEPGDCTGFSYQTKRVLIFEEGKITDKTRHPKAAEEAALAQMIEQAAKSAYKAITGS